MGRVAVEAVLDLLPQTQCRRCGYDDCRGYAQAIAGDGAAINRCPPGGAEGIERLARLTQQPVLALDAGCGSEAPRALALVDEAWCIGCALCLKACPVDAIVGAAKRMHTVIASWCTGCELCIPPCPVDCIVMEPIAAIPLPDLSRARHERLLARRQRDHDESLAHLASHE
jgi:electron transport complex protein RnfB